MLLRRTESHDLLDTRPVVPGPVEQDDLTPRRQVRDIALVVPLPAFPLGGCRQRGYPRDARAQIFGDALDGPTLARGVATFEDDHDPGPGFPGPFLEPHEFRLKPEKFGLVNVFGDLSCGLLVRFFPTLTHRRIVLRRDSRAVSNSSSSDSRSRLGGTSRSLIASRSALTPRYNIRLYDVPPIASTWLGSSGGTEYVSSSLVPATYICFCAPGTLVINRLNWRAEKSVATRIPMACNVGGVRDLRKPDHRVALPDREVHQEGRNLADRLSRPRGVEFGVGVHRHGRH